MWIRIDDNFIAHPKVQRAAEALGDYGLGRVLAGWLTGQTYTLKHQTDGFIPARVVRTIDDPHPQKVVQALVDVALWEAAPGGYCIHDFHDYNPSADKVKAAQKRQLARQQEWLAKRIDRRAGGATESGDAHDESAGEDSGGPVDLPDEPGDDEVTEEDLTRAVKNGVIDGINNGINNAVVDGINNSVKDGVTHTVNDARPSARARAAGSRPVPIPSRTRPVPTRPVPDQIDPSLSPCVCTRPDTHPPAFGPPLGQKTRTDVAWPGRPPVPGSLHLDFRSKLGCSEDEAERRLRAWYPTVAAEWEGRPIGDDDFTFWRSRFREWQGTTATIVRPTRTGQNHQAAADALKLLRTRA